MPAFLNRCQPAGGVGRCSSRGTGRWGSHRDDHASAHCFAQLNCGGSNATAEKIEGGTNAPYGLARRLLAELRPAATVHKNRFTRLKLAADKHVAPHGEVRLWQRCGLYHG